MAWYLRHFTRSERLQSWRRVRYMTYWPRPKLAVGVGAGHGRAQGARAMAVRALLGWRTGSRWRFGDGRRRRRRRAVGHGCRSGSGRRLSVCSLKTLERRTFDLLFLSVFVPQGVLGNFWVVLRVGAPAFGEMADVSVHVLAPLFVALLGVVGVRASLGLRTRAVKR